MSTRWAESIRKPSAFRVLIEPSSSRRGRFFRLGGFVVGGGIAGLRHGEPYQRYGQRTGCGKSEEAGVHAELVRHEPGDRRTQRRTNTRRQPKESDTQVVPALAAGHVGGNQR